MEELLSLEGDADMDLRLLAQSFPTGPAPRVEKREDRYYLILESAKPREDAAVLSDGGKCAGPNGRYYAQRRTKLSPTKNTRHHQENGG